MYHVWKFDARRRVLTMLTSKGLSRWDDCAVPAAWETRSAANAWARRNVPDGYKVMHCEGEDCGMGAHA